MTNNTMPMAWNEPGGNRKNPWGNNQDMPPDLDQVFKKFQQRLGGMFGGGSGGSGSGSTAGGGLAGFGLIFAVLALLYIVFGFYIVHPQEQGVVTRFGKYARTVTEGPHWIPKFIEKATVINTEKLTSTRRTGEMLTKDENILSVEVEVQYRIIDPEKYLFNIRNPDSTFEQAAESALRQVVGESLTDDVLTTKKEQIADSIKEQLIKTLAMYDSGFYVSAVNFKDSRPPAPVKDAFDDVTKSREDRERLKLQADAYYNRVVPEAEGKARQIILEAESYKEETILRAQGEAMRFDLVLPEYNKAPKVTRTRLYIDTMQEVLGQTSKVLIDSDAGNSLIYLPIDKLMSGASGAGANTARKLDAVKNSLEKIANTTDETSRRRGRRG